MITNRIASSARIQRRVALRKYYYIRHRQRLHSYLCMYVYVPVAQWTNEACRLLNAVTRFLYIIIIASSPNRHFLLCTAPSPPESTRWQLLPSRTLWNATSWKIWPIASPLRWPSSWVRLLDIIFHRLYTTFVINTDVNASFDIICHTSM